jgi:hypothetical protein
MLHIAAAPQIRPDTQGRAYYRRKIAAGKTPQSGGALSEAVALIHQGDRNGAPGGHCGASQESSAVDQHIDTSNQPPPGPAQPTQPPARAGANPHTTRQPALRGGAQEP